MKLLLGIEHRIWQKKSRLRTLKLFENIFRKTLFLSAIFHSTTFVDAVVKENISPHYSLS